MSLENDLPDTRATAPAAGNKAEIVKLADADLDAAIANILKMKEDKDRLDKLIKAAEEGIKDQLALRETDLYVGPLAKAEIKHVGESWIVDTDKLKKSGLFDAYKKARAGYDRLELRLRAQ